MSDHCIAQTLKQGRYPQEGERLKDMLIKGYGCKRQRLYTYTIQNGSRLRWSDISEVVSHHGRCPVLTRWRSSFGGNSGHDARSSFVLGLLWDASRCGCQSRGRIAQDTWLRAQDTRSPVSQRTLALGRRSERIRWYNLLHDQSDVYVHANW